MDRILEALGQFLLRLRLWCVVDEYEQAGKFRCGRYRKTLKTGWHWLIPLIDSVEPVYVRPRVLDVGQMSLPTRDGKVIAASGNVEYEIVDTRRALLEVYDRHNSLEGAARGIISNIIMTSHFDNGFDHERLVEQVTTALRQKAKPWGINVRQFWFTELVPHRVFRVLQDNWRNQGKEEQTL